jgi:hypothetical protein
VQTILDDANTWFFHALVHRDEKLQVIVVEGIKAAEPEDLIIGTKNLGSAWRIEVAEASRWVCVSFGGVCGYQVISESLTSADDYEIHDCGFLRVYEKSRYMEFLRSHAIMEHPIAENARHFCILTENQIIDVAAVEEPEFEFILPTKE